MEQICFLGPDGSGKSTLIPLFAKELEARGLASACISTTKPVPTYPASEKWREQLVSPSSTNFERFNAAHCLYVANVSYFVKRVAPENLGLLDCLVLDRGGSSMITYNPIPNRKLQMVQIPEVGFAFYITAGFDQLTERIRARGVTDYQDTNEEFRRKVYENGEQDFNDWLDSSGTKGVVFDTSAGTSEENAKQLAEIFIALASQGSSVSDAIRKAASKEA